MIEIVLRVPLNRELEHHELDQNFVNLKAAIEQLQGATGNGLTIEQVKTIAEAEFAKYVGAAPEQLSNLDALAEAIGDDANFANTISKKFGEVELALSGKVSTRQGYGLIEIVELERIRKMVIPDMSLYQKSEQGKGLISILEAARLAKVDNQDISGKADIAAKASTELVLKFDVDTVVGKVTNTVNGPITVDLFDTARPPKLGVTIMMHHRNSTTAPPITPAVRTPAQPTTILTMSGEYKPGRTNLIMLCLAELPTSVNPGVVMVVYAQNK